MLSHSPWCCGWMDLIPYLHDGLNSAKACECVLFSKWDCLRTSYIDSLWSKFDFNLHQAISLNCSEACLAMPSATPRIPHPWYLAIIYILCNLWECGRKHTGTGTNWGSSYPGFCFRSHKGLRKLYYSGSPAKILRSSEQHTHLHPFLASYWLLFRAEMITSAHFHILAEVFKWS